MNPVDIDPSSDAAAREDGIEAVRSLLHTAAEALRGAGVAQRMHSLSPERIPLERVELELARVVRMELGHLLARAHALSASRAHGSNAHESIANVHALQRDAAESIAVARTCGVAVPRIVRRLVAGDLATWPAPERLARWAEALEPGALSSASLSS
jgi:hypothetical protein